MEYAKRNLPQERAAVTQRDKLEEMLPPPVKEKLEIVFQSFLKRLLHDGKPVNVAQIVKEELARQFSDLTQEQAHILTFYVDRVKIGIESRSPFLWKW